MCVCCRFYALLKDWLAKVHHIIDCIGTDQLGKLEKEGDKEEEEEAPPLMLSDLLVEAEKWRGALSHAVDTSDTLITAQVPYSE